MRLIRCTSGAVAFTLAIKPTFAFATEPAEIIPSEQEGALFKSRHHALHVHAPSPFVQRENQASATVQLQAGEAFPLVLTYMKPNEPATPPPFAAVQRALEETSSYIERRLMRNGLVYRYLDADDGIPGGEGTFAICTFWLIQNDVLLGRLTEAGELFRHVLSFANDVGLFAEEIDPVTGELLGNFPQAFTHIALINAAVRLAAARQGKKPAEHAMLEDAAVRPGRQRA